MKENAKIPKVIHYFWFGRGPKTKLIKKCLKSWKKYCPDYEIKEWNEDNFDVCSCDYAKEAYEAKKWAFVSDYARLWAIYNYGGIYLDTDVELIRSLDTLLQEKAFFASEEGGYINSGLGFGAQKHNSLVKYLLDEYYDIHFARTDGTLDMTPCPVRQTRRIKEKYKNFKIEDKAFSIDGVSFFPKEYFSPLNSNTRELHKTKNTYGIHWYSATWLPDSQKRLYRKNVIKTKIVNLLQRLLGPQKYKKIRNKLRKK